MIHLENVFEKYRIKFVHAGKTTWQEISALSGISLDVRKGEVLGIIGQNGSGKTTLLKLIAGMLMPDQGKVDVQGKVSVLMELGAGFNPEFTGRENIALNARMYGFDVSLAEAQTDKIIEFSGLGEFIDAPIKYYSQGMYARLAFALAIFVNPDILLIDDILSVGDEEAQQKCIKKVMELKDSGKTILLVSHDMNMVTRLCDRVVLLSRGSIVKEGLPQSVIPYYLDTTGDKKGIAILEKGKARVIFNNGKIQICYADIFLTKQSGGHVSFFSEKIGGWLSSLNLLWKINSAAPDEIVLDGYSSEDTICQTWALKLSDNGLQWIVEVKENIKTPHIDLYLRQEYRNWLTLDKKSNIGPFAYKSQRQDLGIKCPENMLGLSAEHENDMMPGLFLENEPKEGLFKVFNSGYEQESRIIQAHFEKGANNLKIGFFPDNKELEGRIRFFADQLALKQQQELERLIASRTLSSGDLRLFVDLDNKSLRLYFKDKELTRATGLNSSFLLNDNWYDISSCSWQFDREGETAVLNFNWKQFKITQTWKLYFKDGALNWEAVSRNEDNNHLNMLKFGLSLKDEYKRFFCSHQEAAFPELLDCWQDIALDERSADYFGVRKQDSLPAVFFENKHGLSCIIQNSDDKASLRVLQLGLSEEQFLKGKEANFFGKLEVKEDDSFISGYVEEEQRKVLLRKQQELERLIASRTLSSGDLRLFVDLDNKSLRLYFKDKELTRATGLNSSLTGPVENFNFDNAEWSVLRVSEQQIRVALKSQMLPLTQIWDITASPGGLIVNIDLDLGREAVIQSFDVNLTADGSYESWKTPDEYGHFGSSQYIGDIAPVRLKNSKVCAVELEGKLDKQPVNLSFDALLLKDRQVLGIYKDKKDNLSVRLAQIIAYNEQLKSAGRYNYFRGEISVNKESALARQNGSRGDFVIGKEDLTLSFDRGIGRIFWKGNELTAGLGLFTSVRHAGIWLDSSQAIWKIKQKEENLFFVSGDWPYIPLSQEWSVEIKNNLVLWSVKMDIHKEIRLDIMQANLMLPADYRQWKAPDSLKGEFLDEFTEDYDILPFRFWYGRAAKDGIIVKGGTGFPQLCFKQSAEKGKQFFGIIENTDHLYKARMIQYQSGSPQRLALGRHHYFQGAVEIGHQEKSR